MNLPTARAIAATGARTLNAHALPDELRVATDSRALARGETFLALRGERFDGHRFVGAALACGAAALVVEDAAAVPEGIPALLVADTKTAYLALAAEARAMLTARVVAITGSTGKTTTKALLHQLLSAVGLGKVAATPANENNEFGVAKLFVGLDPGVDVVVVEFGARHYGDIAQLVAVAQPDVAVLTNVGDAHLAIMGSPERLAETKWGVFASGAVPVLNVADRVSRERAPTLAASPHWFGAVAADASPSFPGAHATVLRGSTELIVRDGDRSVTYGINCRLPGHHNRENAAAACAAAIAIGAQAEAVAGAVEGLALPSGRYERLRIGSFDVIFDAYNASMAGTLATLDAFAQERGARRIAVLASMAELGTGSPAMHERVGAAAAHAGLAALLVGGEHSADLARGARAAGLAPERLVRFDCNAAAVQWLRANARDGDLVLLKGSRMYKLEEIVEGLRSDAG